MDAEQLIDFHYGMSDFATVDGPQGTEPGKGYTAVPDRYLPFDVVPEHKSVVMRDDKLVEECAANRKWSYFYDDSMFSGGTHYIIKNNDTDDFNLDAGVDAKPRLRRRRARRERVRRRTRLPAHSCPANRGAAQPQAPLTPQPPISAPNRGSSGRTHIKETP